MKTEAPRCSADAGTCHERAVGVNFYGVISVGVGVGRYCKDHEASFRAVEFANCSGRSFDRFEHYVLFQVGSEEWIALSHAFEFLAQWKASEELEAA